jgi:AsmA protein
VVETSKGQEGSDLAALKGVTVPVKLSGPFEAIDYRILWSRVAASVLENRLKNTIGDALGGKPKAPSGAASAPQNEAPQSSKDRLRDKLKGLIK